MFDLSAGQLVADKYRIDGVIGAGGMGVVLAATHLVLDQLVAIKVLRDASSESVSRFQREAKLIVRLKSEHVARVFDVGTLDDDTPYYVMERLEGEDLAKILEKRGPLPVENAVDYILEACEAVAEAHTLGMVHRDLKPANLFMARGPGGIGSVKVLDFGISKGLVTEGSQVGELTGDGEALGSPGYMAPEQIESSRSVDARADIYSLGAILYRLTSGWTPHEGDTLMSVLASMASKPVTALTERVPGISPRFAEVVERCLSHDPAARPASIAVLAQELAPFGSRRAEASVEQIFATMGHRAPTSETRTLQHPITARRPAGRSAPVMSADLPTQMVETGPQLPPHMQPSMQPMGDEAFAETALGAAYEPMLPAMIPAMVSEPNAVTAASSRRGAQNPNILPLALAACFFLAVILFIALKGSTKPAARPDAGAQVAVEAVEPTATVVPIAPTTPVPTASVVAPTVAPTVVAPRIAPSPAPSPRHPAPTPRPAPAPRPRTDPNAPPNLNDMPGGRH